MTARHTLAILAVAALSTAVLLHGQPVPAPLQIVTTVLPAAQVGAFYNQQILTTGGACLGTLTFTPSSTIDAGALPPGIYIASPTNTKQWFLQGTPTSAGSFTFTVDLSWTHVRVS